ncbi:hypothetical protein FA13DRAFT_1795007 [Coprinellus micaceus]|uniref:Core-binding (CB) domain-containing protein n=1 Tax=Coprinellus micaceus TaxID=71717 RepID=A0A4Y7SZB3_COPMI|nr:hypothetical protein FA13DRAFT_1795007 [Coprinellus micaceus]
MPSQATAPSRPLHSLPPTTPKKPSKGFCSATTPRKRPSVYPGFVWASNLSQPSSVAQPQLPLALTMSTPPSPTSSQDETPAQPPSPSGSQNQVLTPRTMRAVMRGSGIPRTGLYGERARMQLTSEEREQRAEESARSRRERLYGVTTPHDVPTRDYFLGYTLYDIRDTKLVLSKHSRPFVKKSARALIQVAKPDGSGLRPLDHEHAIHIAVDPQAVDVQCLTQSMHGPYQTLRWRDMQAPSTVTLLQGQVRRSVSLQLTRHQTQEQVRLRNNESKILENPPHLQGDLPTVRQNIERLERAILPKTQWVAAVYSKGTAYATQTLIRTNHPSTAALITQQDASPAALLRLLSNNRIPPSPDSEDHTLSTLFSLAHQHGRDHTNLMLEYGSTLQPKHALASRALQSHGDDFLDFVIATRVSNQFAHFYTHSRRLITVQQHVWGLVAPIFWFMLKQLTYICSNASLEEPQQPASSEFRQRLFSSVNQPPDARYVSTRIANSLVRIADEAFNETLADHIRFVGTDSSEYLDAFDAYAKDLSATFRDCLQNLGSEDSEEAPLDERDAQVAQYAPTKLKYILEHQSAFRAEGCPSILGKVPLLSPMCATAMLDDWVSVADMLYIISNFFVPNLSLLKVPNANPKAPSSAPFTSYPSAIPFYLRYWLGYRSHPRWGQLQHGGVEEMLNGEHGEEEEAGSEVVDLAFYTLARSLWRRRETIIRPTQRVLAPPSLTKPSRSRDDQPGDPVFEENLKTAGQSFLHEWLVAITTQAKITQEHVSPRLHPSVPPHVLQSIQEWEQQNEEDRTLPLFQDLQSCCLNFLVSFTGPTNNRSHHSNALTSLYRERLFWQSVLPHLELLPSFASLLASMVEVVHRFSGLEHSPFWIELPDLPRTFDPVNEEYFHTLFVRRARDSRLEAYEKALKTFAKHLAKPNCLGVLPSDQPLPSVHPALRQVFDTLSQLATRISHQLSLVSHSLDLAEFPLLEEEWNDGSPEDEDDPSEPDPSHENALSNSVPFASISDLQDIYRQEEVVEARRRAGNYDDGNRTIDADAVDADYGTMQTLLSLRRAPSIQSNPE